MSQERDLETLRRRFAEGVPRICPSLLNCDFAILADEVCDAERCGARSVHWDAMDGHFVPNLSYGPPVIASLRPRSGLFFEAHLMLSDPEKYLDGFLAAGCDSITVHVEAVPNPGEVLSAIRRGGALAGLALNPPTPVATLVPWLGQVDLVVIMSVMPGFGGQRFQREALGKIEWVRRAAPRGVLVEIDGGINRDTIADAAGAGAQLFVAGSAFYRAPDRRAELATLTRLAGERFEVA